MMISSKYTGYNYLISQCAKYATMHKGIWIINLVVSSSMLSISSRKINFVATRETLYVYCHKGWFNKAAAPGTLHVCLKLVVAWRGV